MSPRLPMGVLTRYRDPGNYAACCLNFSASAGLPAKPTIWSTSLPSLKKRIVGMDRTLNFVDVLMFTSTSTLATLAFPSYSTASWSRTGATMRQGAHQVAQKSTTASPLCCSIWLSKSASFTSTAFDIFISPTRGKPLGSFFVSFHAFFNKFNDPINPARHAGFAYRDRGQGHRRHPSVVPGYSGSEGGCHRRRGRRAHRRPERWRAAGGTTGG